LDKIEKLREEAQTDLTFSKYKLDDAAEKQAILYDKWHQRYVDALSYLEVEKRNLSEVKAELEGKLRKALVEGDTSISEFEFSCYKATEGAISTAIDNHKGVKEITLKISSWKKEVDVLKGIADAFQQKRSMIKVIAELTLIGYLGDLDYVKKQKSEIDQQIAETTRVPRRRKRSSKGGK
jgi:hypothetical protein